MFLYYFLISFSQENTYQSVNRFSEGMINGLNPGNTVFKLRFLQKIISLMWGPSCEVLLHGVLLLLDQTVIGQITQQLLASDEVTGYHSYIPYPRVSEDDALWVKELDKFSDIRITSNRSVVFPNKCCILRL